MFVSYQMVRNAMMVGGFLFLSYLVYSWYSTEKVEPRVASFDPQSVSPVPVLDATADGISMGTEGNGVMVKPLLNSGDSSGSSAGSTGEPVSNDANTDAKSSNVNALVAAAPPASKASQVKNSSEDRPLLASAMKIATAASKPGVGKDVLGASSPWKLNLYDDNADGQWDRGKLDFNRDDVDDEKWNFKEGRWEKEGGHEIWNGTAWQASDAPVATVATTATPAKPASSVAPTADEALTNYRAAMKIATAKAVKGKGKDVLGAKSKWKLNLYDDNNDGQWDRGKLDTNRDDVDDEKWNFKQGRWEKDGGAKIWNGENWVSP